MPWSWVNTEYTIHQVQHHPKIDSLPLPASFSSLSGCCTQLSTFPQLQVNQWIESQLLSRLPPNRPPPSTPPISLDHSLQVPLQTRSVTASECISKLDWSRPPSASSELTRPWPPSASPNSLDPGLQVHLSVHSLSVSKCISNTLDQVHHQGETVVVQRFRGNGGGQSDGEYIFGRPRSR